MPDNFLNDFKSNIGQLSRPYLFYVNVDSSPGVVEIPDYHKYLVRSTSMPETTIEAIEVPFQGMMYKMGGTTTYAEWECTFNADNDMQLRKGFHDWSNAVHNPQNNAHGTPEDYLGEISIELLDPFQNFTQDPDATYTTTLYGCWPSSVGSIELDYSNNTDVTQFAVTFTYLYHVEEIG